MIVGGASQTPVPGGGPAGPPPDQTPPADRFVPMLSADGDDSERAPLNAVEPAEPLTGTRANRDADLFWAAPAIGVHELVDGGVERWRERMREHREAACIHLTHHDGGAVDASGAAVRAPVRTRGDRPRAGAVRRVRDPDDGRQPACRPAPGGGATARAGGRDRRRGGAAGGVRRAGPISADAGAADPADAFRRRGPELGRSCSRTRSRAWRAGSTAPRSSCGSEPRRRAPSITAGGSTLRRGCRR